MTLKMKLTIGVGLMVILLFSAITFYSNYEMVRLVEKQEEAHYTMINNLVRREMAQQLETAKVSVETIAHNQEVQRLFANRDRESLLEDLLPVYQQIEDRVAQFQFHLPDSTSFLRLHNPAKYGDSLKDFRLTVNECNQTKKLVMGLEEGVAGFGFRVVMPMFYQGKHTGSVEYGLNFHQEFLDKLQQSYDGQYLIYYLKDVDPEGVLIPELGVATVTEDLWPTPQELIDQVQARETLSYLSAKKNKGILLIPFVDYTDTVKGYIKVVLSREEILQMIEEINHELLLISLVCIALILGLIYLLIGGITKNLDAVIENIQEIATGKLYLRVKEVKSRDELSKLSKVFNQMIDKFQSVLQEISSTSGQLSRSSNQLNQVTANSSAAAEEVGASIEEVSQRSNEQSILMDEASQLVQQMSAEVTTLGDAGEEAKQVAMTNASHVKESKQAITQIQQQMEEIKATMGGTADVVTDLIDRSSQIGKIVEIINGIANQTQLLALNAAIEAARAGESGRGFSVVADEIKQLAEGTVDSAQEITTLIAETITRSNNVKTAMEKGLDKVEVGNEVVHSTSTIFNQMVTASEANLEFIASTDEGIQKVVQLNQQILEKISAVAAIAQETAASAEEVSASTEEQVASTEEVAISAEQLQDMAQELETLIAQFAYEEDRKKE